MRLKWTVFYIWYNESNTKKHWTKKYYKLYLKKKIKWQFMKHMNSSGSLVENECNKNFLSFKKSSN